MVISHREARLGLTSFPDSNHSQDPRHDGDIDWYYPQSGTERVLTFQYAVFRDGENYGTEVTCNGGSNNPCRKGLEHSPPAPADAIRIKCGRADVDEATYDEVFEWL